MLQAVGRFIVGISGWRVVGEVPQLPKAVFIAAPHTSNWDGFWLLVARAVLDIKVSFMAKHTLFWWPLGPLLSAMGAMPIDRSNPSQTVPKLIETFRRQNHLFLAMAPEGTRRWQPYWKTGFYRIAAAAGVPIVLAFIDYRKKEMGIGMIIEPRDREHDMTLIREFYRPLTPRHPALRGPIAFPPE